MAKSHKLYHCKALHMSSFDSSLNSIFARNFHFVTYIYMGTAKALFLSVHLSLGLLCEMTAIHFSRELSAKAHLCGALSVFIWATLTEQIGTFYAPCHTLHTCRSQYQLKQCKANNDYRHILFSFYQCHIFEKHLYSYLFPYASLMI